MMSMSSFFITLSCLILSMGQTKIGLSPEELELVNNAGWILTKNAIIEKVYGLFGGLSDAYRDEMQKHPLLLTDAGVRSPKISKGEQYEGLPWVMLDYPRNYTGDDAFGIRSFFWWGNYCSITLQLAGVHQQKFSPAIRQWISAAPANWFIGNGGDPWKHHFRKDNYTPLDEWQGNINTLPFIKLATRISLHQWDALDDFFVTHYRELIRMLATTS
jgi:hypothetical protein